MNNEIVTFITQLHTVQQVLLFIMVGYGFALGLSNTYYRVRGWFGYEVGQNAWGMLMDASFYGLIAYFTFLWMSL